MQHTAKLGFFPAVLVALCLQSASAADGLQTPDATAVWPSWQTRLTITLGEEPQSGVRSLHQAALLGDFYWSPPDRQPSAGWRGGFRATSGLVLGHLGASALPGGQALSLFALTSDDSAAARDAAVLPYIGLGYSGLMPRGGWGFTADVGLALRQPGAAPELGRALLGLRGWEGTLRRVDLMPMVQLGVRYSF
jgi:hypothetical protein